MFNSTVNRELFVTKCKKFEAQINIAVSCSHYNPDDKSPQCLE